MTRAKTGRRWALAGVWFGAGGSLAANVAHAWLPPSPTPANWHPSYGAMAWGVVVAVALVISLGVLEQIPWPGGARWIIVRFGGGGVVAAVAAWTSYRHLAGLLAAWGEPSSVIYGGPAIVDGLMALSSGALLALAGPTSTCQTADLEGGAASPATGDASAAATPGVSECATEMQSDAAEPSASDRDEVHPTPTAVQPEEPTERVRLSPVRDIPSAPRVHPSPTPPDAGRDVEEIAREISRRDQIPSLRALMDTYSIGQPKAQLIKRWATELKAKDDQGPSGTQALTN